MSTTELIDAYLAGIDALEQATAGLTPAQAAAKPADGSWSITEIVAHLSDTEALFAERMKRVLVEDRPPLPVADPDGYVRALAYDSRDLAEEVALFVAVRRQMARVLRKQPPEAWRRVGIHSTDGEKSLEQIAAKAVAHLEHHLGFVRAKRERMGA